MPIPSTVALTPEQQAQLAQYIDQGRFASVDEAIANALLLLDQSAYAIQPLPPAAIARIQLGLDQLARGEAIDSDRWHSGMELRMLEFEHDGRATYELCLQALVPAHRVAVSTC